MVVMFIVVMVVEVRYLWWLSGSGSGGDSLARVAVVKVVGAL